MLRSFPRWRQSLGRTPLEEKLPWMSFSAIDFLNEKMRKNWEVFEWGVGGSTNFLAFRVNQLVSVEHDPDWAEKVQLNMNNGVPTSWQLIILPPKTVMRSTLVNPCNPLDYSSAVECYSNKSFQDYATVIDRFENGHFDLVIVDGRCRLGCAMHAITKLKPGGYLIFDDCERPRYTWIHDEMKRLDWEFRYFNGPGPFTWDFRHTGCWKKPEKS